MIFIFRSDPYGRKKDTLLNIIFGPILNEESHRKITTKRMADENDIFMLIIVQNTLNTLHIKLLSLFLFNRRILNFICQSHSPNLP